MKSKKLLTCVYVKRIFDFTLSFAIIILTSPFLLLILLIIFVLTKQSPILVQERGLTLDRGRIKIFKLRTIRNTQSFLQLENRSNKIFDKREYEKFVPMFCKWLRRSGIDEFPQFINVLLGDMSVVGPRPLTVSDLLLMKENEPKLYELREKIYSKPGITGFWQVFGNREKGTRNLIELDKFYDENKSISLDVKILFLTSIIVFSAQHWDSILSTIENRSSFLIQKYIYAEKKLVKNI